MRRGRSAFERDFHDLHGFTPEPALETFYRDVTPPPRRPPWAPMRLKPAGLPWLAWIGFTTALSAVIVALAGAVIIMLIVAAVFLRAAFGGG